MAEIDYGIYEITRAEGGLFTVREKLEGNTSRFYSADEVGEYIADELRRVEESAEDEYS